MAAAKENLTIENGITFEKTWIYADAAREPISLAAYEARMQIRERIDSTAFLVELNSTVGGINLEQNAETGRIDVRIAADVTDTFTFDRAVYDLEIYLPADATTVYRLVGGSVILKEGVTR